MLSVRKRLYGSIANCQSSNCFSILVPLKNFLFRRTFSPAVFTGQLSSCPLVGRRMGWKSISVLVKHGGQRGGGRGRAVKERVCSRSPVCHFGEGIVFSRDMYWIGASCHKKEGGAELFLSAECCRWTVQWWCSREALRIWGMFCKEKQTSCKCCLVCKTCSKDRVRTQSY